MVENSAALQISYAEGAHLMSASPVSVESSASVTKPLPPESDKPAASSQGSAGWKRYVTPLLVVLLALAVLITITRNWNAWEGGKVEQVTDDAYVRGDLTPLSTKVAGIVRTVHVADFQRVHKGELIVELQDDDYRAQFDQASAAVEAARAAIENNRRQRALQDSRIAKALAGIDQAKAQIAAAEAGKQAVEAQVVRARSERKRQESLYQTHSATQQTLEAAVANDDQLSAQLASRDADLNQAQTMLRSSELSAEAERRSKAVLESQDMQLQADLHAKQASLAAAMVNLGYTKIYAPGEGTVGERQVRPGQLVSPGTQVIAFVDVTKWVQANYRETQLTNVKIGDPAELRIDQYPGQVIRGKVLEIAPASGSQFSLLPPDNATGNFTKVVQRIPVKIALDDSAFAAKLRPGLSVIATVRTRR
jgi:membrane fusion protein, multidrug efflux system